MQFSGQYFIFEIVCTMFSRAATYCPYYLVLVNFCFFQLRLSLLLEGDDNESDEDVDKEEREDDEVDDVKDGHLNAKEGNRSLVLESGGHRLCTGNSQVCRISHNFLTLCSFLANDST